MSAHRSARSPPSRRPVSAVGAAAHRGAAAILEEFLNEPMPSSACALKDRGLGVPHLIGQAMPENSIAATRWPRGRASFGEKKSVDGELDPPKWVARRTSQNRDRAKGSRHAAGSLL